MSGLNGEDHETDCSEVIGEVYLYLDLECSDDRRTLIQKHLDECSGCLREYGIEHEVKALVARCCGDETAPQELRERLRIKLDQLEIQVETHEFRF
jgi:mycothiol system anti-sigma-R factor